MKKKTYFNNDKIVVKVPIQYLKSYQSHSTLQQFSNRQIDMQPLIQEIDNNGNPKLNILIRRHNIHFQITDQKDNCLNQNQNITISTDEEGYLKTRKSIATKIQDYLEMLFISNKQILIECQKLLNKILYNIPIVFRSKPHKAIALVIILFACRKQRFPITLKKIVKATRIKQKSLNKCLLTLKRILPEVQSYGAKSIDFLEDYSKKLNLHQKVIEVAKYILKRIESAKLNNSTHKSSIAACTIYLAIQLFDSKIKIKLEDIAKAAECSKTTIRSYYNFIYPYKQYILPRLE